ncbi:MAG: glycosyltransferase family 39 protein, partial [Bacteroidia bacterium]|nr:glycosyltransferase family 39 protein [Bacteroidia bacterium]
MKQKKKNKTSVKVSSLSKKTEKSSLLNSKPFLIGLTILAALVILFPTLSADFTNWDDNKFIVDNPYIKEISSDNFSGMYKDNPGTSLFSFVSWSFEYALFELNPTAFHTTNLILHIICVILVFQFIYLLCNQLHVSFFTTLFFVVHPMHVEAVAWIIGRSWLFCTAFCLVTFIYYIKYYKEREQKYLFISLGFYGLALLSQGAAMSLAPLLLMIDFLFKRKLDKKLILEKLPYLIMAILL